MSARRRSIQSAGAGIVFVHETSTTLERSHVGMMELTLPALSTTVVARWRSRLHGWPHVIVLVMFLLTGCAKTQPVARVSPYTDQVRAEFFSTCRRTGQTTQACECIFQYYVDKVPVETFREVQKTRSAPHEIRDGVLERCGVQIS
jgi:hypothetical protein